MKKNKHIKYTKLSPIMLKTIPSPAESPFCRTSKKNRHAASAGDFIVVRFALIGSLGVAT